MGFTNSPLAKIVAISPNRTSPRNQAITKITVHHMAGVLSAQDFCNIVARPSREMSANYGIGYDGTIALTCPEGDRSWCSSSPWNDHRAITIEVSNSASGGEWPIGNAAYSALIDLCVDICKRNNKDILNRNTLVTNHAFDAFDHYARLAGARSGGNEKILLPSLYGLELFWRPPRTVRHQSRGIALINTLIRFFVYYRFVLHI